MQQISSTFIHGKILIKRKKKMKQTRTDSLWKACSPLISKYCPRLFTTEKNKNPNKLAVSGCCEGPADDTPAWEVHLLWSWHSRQLPGTERVRPREGVSSQRKAHLYKTHLLHCDQVRTHTGPQAASLVGLGVAGRECNRFTWLSVQVRRGWIIRDTARLMLEMRGVKDKGKRDMLGLESTHFILFKIEAVWYMSPYFLNYTTSLFLYLLAWFSSPYEGLTTHIFIQDELEPMLSNLPKDFLSAEISNIQNHHFFSFCLIFFIIKNAIISPIFLKTLHWP